MKPLYFEDFQVGQEFITKCRIITGTDVANFAALPWGTNQLHTNA